MANIITHKRIISDPPIAKFLFSDTAWHSSGWPSAGFIGLDNVLLRMLGTRWRASRKIGPRGPRGSLT